jgi:hypothetical protein
VLKGEKKQHRGAGRKPPFTCEYSFCNTFFFCGFAWGPILKIPVGRWGGISDTMAPRGADVLPSAATVKDFFFVTQFRSGM